MGLNVQNNGLSMPFQKGKSGNPGGRPKEENEVRDLARKHTKPAIERLAFWMNSDNAKASVAASATLLDRAWGKAPQSLQMPANSSGKLVIEWSAE